jgi:circadian clock protein KaiC
MREVDDGSSSTTTLERVPSGIPGLDVILRGGFFRGGVYMVLARPGAGKTILGNHICFRHVASGGRALFVTLLTESHGRMLAQMRNLQFFDPKVVGKALLYVAGYQALAEGGLKGLLTLIRKVVRDQSTTLLVLDGLVTAGALAETHLEMKKFIHELQTFADMVGCTTLLLTGGNRNRDEYAQRTMVDGLLTLHLDAVGMDAVRSIEIEKLRGCAFLMGRHLFEITDAGVVIHPRTEILLGRKACERSGPAEAPLAFGIESLDALVGGGLVPGSITMLLGAPGTGKTLLGLNFLTGAGDKEPGLCFGFVETQDELARRADSTGSDLRRRLKRGLLEIRWHPPIDGTADALAAELIAAVRKRGVQRLFIDGLGGFRNALVYPERQQNFFGALFNELRALGVTTVLAEETRDLFGAEVKAPSELVAMLDNVIFLRHVELRARLRRLVSVVKMREGISDPSLREFSIGKHGIEVSPTFDSAEAILTGIARVTSPTLSKPTDARRKASSPAERPDGAKRRKRRRRTS